MALGLGLPEQAMRWLPLRYRIEDKLLNFYVLVPLNCIAWLLTHAARSSGILATPLAMPP